MLPRPEGRVEQDQTLLVFAFREARVPRIAPRPTPGLRFGANCGLARNAARCTKSANLKLSPSLRKGGEGGQTRLIRGWSPRPDLAREGRSSAGNRPDREPRPVDMLHGRTASR
jgi:hypothetical protein